ncbi:MAG: DUF4126 domain-containing protein [Candidatus Thermoplasmatota archaeon]|nr:DUF4126 domain-containing protein [Candidatus Thermoplasmatota archaeon]
MELFLALSLGLGLAAASGFRVFLPPFLYGLAIRFDYTPIDIPVQGASEWMSSDVGLILLGSAMALEILAYYIPWLDNLMDTIASPAAIVSGIVMVSSTLTETDPIIQWALAIIIGGGVSGTIQVGTVSVRALSTMTTGGIANPLVSTVEAGACIFCTILAILLPLIALLLTIPALFLSVKFFYRRKQKMANSPSTLGTGA